MSEPGSNSSIQLTFMLSIPDNERIQRVVRAAPRSESVREPEEVFLVDRVEHRNSRPLGKRLAYVADQLSSLADCVMIFV